MGTYKRKASRGKKYSHRINEILKLPDIVKISKRDACVHLYYKFFKDIFGGKYLLTVINSKKRTISTLFITDKIKVGDILWERK